MSNYSTRSAPAYSTTGMPVDFANSLSSYLQMATYEKAVKYSRNKTPKGDYPSSKLSIKFENLVGSLESMLS